MSTKSFLLGAIAITAMAFATPSFAHWNTGDSSDYASGIYIGIAGGYGHANWDDAEDFALAVGFDTAEFDCGDFGVRGFLGYDFNENFSVEVGYLHMFDNMGYKFTSGSTVYEDCIQTTAYDAVLKLRVYLDNGFSVYTKLGVARMEACDAFTLSDDSFEHSDNSSTNVTFGAGFSYCLTPCFVANVDWQHYRGCDSGEFLADLDFFSLGFAYKFAV